MTTAQKYWTLSEIQTKVKRDLAIEAEIFIEPDELTEYVNDAIQAAEAIIISIFPDYFLSTTTLSLVSGEDEIDLPSTIFAYKIRRLTYRNGTKVYTLRRFRDWHKFEAYEIERVNESSLEYGYFLINDTAGDPKILISPPAKETGAYIRAWVARQANRLSSTSDVCDIPEFINFIFWEVKFLIMFKEGHPLLDYCMQERDKWESRMRATLDDMVPDADNEIELDVSHYEEMT